MLASLDHFSLCLTVSQMKSPNEPADSPLGVQKNVWVMVVKAAPKYLQEYSLVLSAVGIDHQLDSQQGVILVRKNHGERAMFELQSFREENYNWPPPTVHPTKQPN
ncbi:MAG: hypothetical protein D3923_19340, partial [Candidatus Electrothrix sp. AR3]|nr:hypothetical protein [Candidatus Electrothrix sp. AR3]